MKPAAHSFRHARMVVAAGALLLATACQSPEERMQSHYESGQRLLAEGETQKAALEFRNVLQINQDHVGALYGISKYHQEHRNWEALAAVLSKAIELDPEHLDARIDFCRLMFLGGIFDQALETCSEAEHIKADDARVHALQAAIYHRLEDDTRAVSLAKAALELDSANIDALIVLAAQALAAEETREALAHLEVGLDVDQRNIGLQVFKIQILDQLRDTAGAEAVLRKLISFYPENAAFRSALVRYYVSKDLTEDAEAELRSLANANPDDTQAALNVVRFVNEQHGSDAAEQELRALVTARSDRYEYPLALADLLWRQDKRDEAKKLSQAVIDGAGDGEIPAKLQMARMLVAEKDDAQAEELIAQVLEQDSRNVPGLVLRAAILAERSAYDDAISDLRTALNEDPGSPQILLPLAQLHELNGAVELAEDRLAIAFRSSNSEPSVGQAYSEFLLRHGEPDRSEEVLSRVIERDPGNTTAIARLAQLRLNRQDWAGAQRLADQLGQIEDQRGLSRQILGAALSGQERFDASIAILQEAQTASPAAAQPMVSLVRAYVQADKRDEAMSFLQGIIESDPGRAVAQVLIGSLHALDGDMEAAKERYQLAISNSPEDPQGYRALAAQLVSEGEREDALEVVMEGLAQQPENLVLLLLSAGIEEALGNIDRAIDIYQKMYDLRPQSVVVANNLASLLAEHRTDQASLDRAYRLAQRLRNSDIPQFKDTLAWVHYKRGENDAAVALLREAIEAPAPLAIYHYHLGLIYSDQGLTALAKKQLETALELGTQQDFPQATDARRALEDLAKAPQTSTN